MRKRTERECERERENGHIQAISHCYYIFVLGLIKTKAYEQNACFQPLAIV